MESVLPVRLVCVTTLGPTAASANSRALSPQPSASLVAPLWLSVARGRRVKKMSARRHTTKGPNFVPEDEE